MGTRTIFTGGLTKNVNGSSSLTFDTTSSNVKTITYYPMQPSATTITVDMSADYEYKFYTLSNSIYKDDIELKPGYEQLLNSVDYVKFSSKANDASMYIYSRKKGTSDWARLFNFGTLNGGALEVNKTPGKITFSIVRWLSVHMDFSVKTYQLTLGISSNTATRNGVTLNPTSGYTEVFDGSTAERVDFAANYGSDGISFTIQETDRNLSPTLSVSSAANNQPLIEGQAVYTGKSDFTIRLTADDPNPADTLQYQIKLNGTVKKDWTSISRNSPVDYTFRASDYTNDRNQFEVSVQDNFGEVTTFSAILVKVDRPEYLGLVKLGTLYYGSAARPRPTKPWVPDKVPNYNIGQGNLPSAWTEPLSGWSIGNTNPAEENQLYWHKIRDGNKTLLICDRAILCNFRPVDLDSMGRVSGTPVTIDGKKYTLRVLTGGMTNSDAQSGDNEWNRYVLNKANISGLPIPSSSDFRSDYGDLDAWNIQFKGELNRFWNWMYIYTMVQEIDGVSDTRRLRGELSAGQISTIRNISSSSSTGWRPVLEVLNSVPTVSLSTSNNQVLTEGNTFTIAGSAKDEDSGNVVTVKYKINNGSERNLDAKVSDGSSPIPFSKALTYRGGRLYDGSTDVSGLLAEGTTHTLSVWAVDDQGGQSAVVTRSFTVKYNKAPALTVNTFTPVQSGLIPPDTITLSGTASDPDGNTVTVKGKMNTGTEKILLSGVSSGNWSFPFKVSELKNGANTITITATDQFGAATVKTFNVKNEVVEKPMKQGVARYKILPPLGSAKEILAWMKREKGDLVIDAEASFVDAGQPEQYVAMVKDSVDLNTEITEDQFIGTAAAPKADVVFKQTLSRTNANSTQAATMLVGVFK